MGSCGSLSLTEALRPSGEYMLVGLWSLCRAAADESVDFYSGQYIGYPVFSSDQNLAL